MGKNVEEISAVAAAAAGVPNEGFVIDFSLGDVNVNHPDSMKWTPEVRKRVELAVTEKTGTTATVT